MSRWSFLLLIACSPPLSALVEPARGDAARPSATGDVRITRATETYVLQGDTAEALRADLARQRTAEERFTGWTRWRLRWRFSPTTTPGGCRLDDIVVDLHLTTVLPRWEAPDHASAALRQDWSGYVTALEAHEAIHGHLAVAAAHHLARDLSHLDGAGVDCTRLQERAEVIGAAHVRELRAANASFDDETRHGATTGAVFPGAPVHHHDGP